MKKIKAVKNYAGIPYLYRKKGAVSTVMEFNMNDFVEANLLQESLDEAIKCHPYLSSTITEYEGTRWLSKCDFPFRIAETRTLRRLGSKEVNYHLIDVTFFEKDIYVAFHHALCDGGGSKKFIELLLELYLSKKYNIEEFHPREELIVSDKDDLDPFGGSFYDIDKGAKKPEVESKGFALPEVPKKMKDDANNRFVYVLDNDSLMKYAKENSASPSIILAILFSKTIKALNPDADKQIVCSMASDLREGLEATGTLKNTVNSIYFSYGKEDEKLSVAELSQKYRNLIKEQKDPEFVKKNANMMVGLFAVANMLPSIGSKQLVLSAFENIKINTYVMSYPGRINLDGLEKYLVSAHLYSCANNGFFINVMAVNNTTSVDIEQSFDDDKYVQEFGHQLNEAGIKYTFEGRSTLLTPRDGVMDEIND